MERRGVGVHRAGSGFLTQREALAVPGTAGRVPTPVREAEGLRVHWLAVFDALSDRLQAALHDVRGRGKLDEEAISRAMREIRLALLEADVNFKVVKDFEIGRASCRERV